MNKNKNIMDFLDSIYWLFDVNNYTKDISFPKEDEEESDSSVVAKIITDHTYRIIKIKIFPIFFKKTKEEQVLTLIHELCHTITEDLFDCYNNMYKGSFVTSEEARHARESSTEQIAYLLYNLGIGKKRYFTNAIKKYIK